jgi:hypothetical protein
MRGQIERCIVRRPVSLKAAEGFSAPQTPPEREIEMARLFWLLMLLAGRTASHSRSPPKLMLRLYQDFLHRSEEVQDQCNTVRCIAAHPGEPHHYCLQAQSVRERSSSFATKLLPAKSIDDNCTNK